MRATHLAFSIVVLLGCSKKELGEPCEEARECESELCQLTSPQSTRSTCTRHCDADADCSEGGRCIGGKCFVGCSSQDDCPDESVCSLDDLCAPACRTSNDCVNAVCPASGEACEPM